MSIVSEIQDAITGKEQVIEAIKTKGGSFNNKTSSSITWSEMKEVILDTVGEKPIKIQPFKARWGEGVVFIEAVFNNEYDTTDGSVTVEDMLQINGTLYKASEVLVNFGTGRYTVNGGEWTFDLPISIEATFDITEGNTSVTNNSYLKI